MKIALMLAPSVVIFAAFLVAGELAAADLVAGGLSVAALVAAADRVVDVPLSLIHI